MQIPIARPYLTEEEAQAAYDVILSGWITQGPKVQEFEEKFASYIGSAYAVAVSSCTTALHLAMVVSGIGPGDEVICPSMSFIATANSIRYSGAIPVFAEVDPSTFNIDPDDTEKRITGRTKAILIVHQMGMPADIDRFKEICSRHNLKLIEDAACAIGSGYKGAKIGSHSDLVCFSFHPRKVISTGDGGMITTSDPGLYQRLKLLRQHGMSVSDQARHQSKSVIIEQYLELGYNYRMTDIQAAIGIKQLEKLDWLVEERRKIAHHYIESLSNIPCIDLPLEQPGYISNYQSFSINITPEAPCERNDLMQKLLNAGISTRRGIMTAHREPAYISYSGVISLPITEDTSDRSLLLPLYVPMKIEDVDYIIRKIREILI
ncbi:MAG: DegT/DnrJ/EryC1/StrS family aminotransferase [Bacteroidetes bacterium]|nr:DegT/DnrJ/EryC1/StrS family aminotransferase [Bacteroidota bacterium]